MSTDTVIWQFTDGKPGHENQTSGLINALENRTSVKIHTIDVPSNIITFIFSLLIGRFYRQLSQLTKPNYLIAAGSTTQLPMQFSHLFFGGKRILLMRPYWPMNWFDHLIIPQHDSPKIDNKILVTQGAINKVSPSSNHDAKQGVILLGGPSKHYFWDSISIIEQITQLLKAHADISWTVANSRRTPDDFETQLQAHSGKVTFIDFRETDSSWLPKQLTGSGHVWVSPDSVSMLYEAITSGAAVGCLDLEEKSSNNRITKGIKLLMEQRIITSFTQWQNSQALTLPPIQLNEAQRAADWILSQ